MIEPTDTIAVLRFDSPKKRDLEPLPMAVHFLEANFAQPLELQIDIDQLVGRIFIGWSNSKRPEKSCV